MVTILRSPEQALLLPPVGYARSMPGDDVKQIVAANLRSLLDYAAAGNAPRNLTF